CVGDWLDGWAEKAPDRGFLAERREGQWYRLSYAEARQRVGALAQSLLDMQLPGGRPLVVLSENDIDHALLSLAAMHVGIPISTVSVAYSRNVSEFSRLQAIFRSLDPALVFVNDAAAYAQALTQAPP